jgi:hypothetical protein
MGSSIAQPTIAAVQCAIQKLNKKYRESISTFLKQLRDQSLMELIIAGREGKLYQPLRTYLTLIPLLGVLTDKVHFRKILRRFSGREWRLIIYISNQFLHIDLSQLLGYWAEPLAQPPPLQDMLDFAEYLDRVSDRRRQTSQAQREVQRGSTRNRNRIGSQSENFNPNLGTDAVDIILEFPLCPRKFATNQAFEQHYVLAHSTQPTLAPIPRTIAPLSQTGISRRPLNMDTMLQNFLFCTQCPKQYFGYKSCYDHHWKTHREQTDGERILHPHPRVEIINMNEMNLETRETTQKICLHFWFLKSSF